MKISIIIPVYNEERTILTTQKNLKSLTGEYEVIFVDGGSTDNTLSMISKPYKTIKSEKGRANQMNKGALCSLGEVLFFMHCDSKFEKNIIPEIQEVMKSYDAGYFGIKFDTNNILMKCCETLSNLRAKRGIVFGDQGIFIKKELFFKLGMFPNIPIMEDYQFSLTASEANVKWGKAKSFLTTSDRRFSGSNFQKLKTMINMNKFRAMYRSGYDIEKISRLYKDLR
ncbi:MAG: TIGR04283 family arsenosugar biosynthesis glycosyltransferase [Proteocatella sp.]